jgi:hypothetical protein
MSFPYRVKLKESVSETVSDSDMTRQKIALEEILTEDDMRGIFKQKLEDQGFSEEEDGTLTKTRETGEKQIADLETMEVTTELEMSQEVSMGREVSVRANRDSDRMSKKEKERFKKKAKEELRAKLERQVKQQAKEREGTMVKEIADKLEASREERTRELNEAVMETYKEALQRKAQSLGSVESISEGSDGDDYEMRIRITE